MKVTQFLRMFVRICRTLAEQQTNKDDVRRLHHIADCYNKMLEQWFAKDESHKDLPGKTVGKVKRFISEHGESLEDAMKELALSLIEQKGGDDMNTSEVKQPKGFICIIERPEGSTYEQEFEVYSLNKQEQLKRCQDFLGPKYNKYSYWAIGGYYIY